MNKTQIKDAAKQYALDTVIDNRQSRDPHEGVEYAHQIEEHEKHFTAGADWYDTHKEVVPALSPAVVQILAERHEQMYKHGYTGAYDTQHTHGELASAAAFALTLHTQDYPHDWHTQLKDKLEAKPYRQRLVIAAALIIAELERLPNV